MALTHHFTLLGETLTVQSQFVAIESILHTTVKQRHGVKGITTQRWRRIYLNPLAYFRAISNPDFKTRSKRRDCTVFSWSL